MRGLEIPLILILLTAGILLLDFSLRARLRKAVFEEGETKTLLLNSPVLGVAKAKVCVYQIGDQRIQVFYEIQGFSGEAIITDLVNLEITNSNFWIYPKQGVNSLYRLRGKLLSSNRIQITFDYKPKPW